MGNVVIVEGLGGTKFDIAESAVELVWGAGIQRVVVEVRTETQRASGSVPAG